jgi:HAD superfamily hydrolase (TIGR01549 family)
MIQTSDGWLPMELNRKVDAKHISFSQFIEGVSMLAQVPVDQTYQEVQNNVADTRLFRYIREKLKPHYKIGLLSNAAENWLDELFTNEQNALFDAIALSCELGSTKPDPRTYQVIAERLKVDPADCLFVDDQITYCHGAEGIGMHAIHYRGFDQFCAAMHMILQTSKS